MTDARGNLHGYVEAAAEASGLPVKVITSRQRRGAPWRHAAMKLARDAGWSSSVIGGAFGMDHTTVLYGERAAQDEFVRAVRACLTGQAELPVD